MSVKPLYFVTIEKRVIHVGFTDSDEIELLESRERLEQHGFREDPSLFKETDDSVFIFCTHLPLAVAERWLDQILRERSYLKELRKGKGKGKRKGKGKKEKEPQKEKEKKTERIKKVQEKLKCVRSDSEIEESPSILRPPSRKRDFGKKIGKIKKVKKVKAQKTSKDDTVVRVKPRPTKTLDMLKAEVRAQKIWRTFVPTCGQCVFWEKRFLRFTRTEAGECTATGNFVSSDKKACSEFQQ